MDLNYYMSLNILIWDPNLVSNVTGNHIQYVTKKSSCFVFVQRLLYDSIAWYINYKTPYKHEY